MDYKKWSFGLGLFSIALGATELLAARRIARTLEAEGRESLIRGLDRETGPMLPERVVAA